MLRSILKEEKIDCNRHGYYLASSGVVAWEDLYRQMAKTLAKHGVVDDDELHEASDESLEQASQAFGCPKEFVSVEMGGA